MLIDTQSTFGEETAISTTAGSLIFGNVIQLVKGGLNEGVDSPWLIIKQGAVAGAGGTSTQFELISADNAALTTNPRVHLLTKPLLLASQIAGANYIMVQLPSDYYGQYLGLFQIVAGTYTAGTASAYLSVTPPGNSIPLPAATAPYN